MIFSTEDTFNRELSFLIWSHDHEMWWRPNRRGYTKEIGEAGLYSVGEASDICQQAQKGPWEGQPKETMVPYVALKFSVEKVNVAASKEIDIGAVLLSGWVDSSRLFSFVEGLSDSLNVYKDKACNSPDDPTEHTLVSLICRKPEGA